MGEQLPPEQGLPPGTVPLPPAAPRPHPVRLVVNDDGKRSRLTVFFRLILAIPHGIWINLWKIAIYVVAFINWWVTLFWGRTPDDLHAFIGRYARYQTHLSAYLTFLANPYPGFFGREGSYPVDLVIEPAAPQKRLITLFRVILGIPAYVLAYVFGIVTGIVAIIGWFICLVLGRMPTGLRDLLAYCRRYRSQTDAYFLLLTDQYPSLSA
jgi:hypothetical protein